jgi:hypothetical protein
MVLEQGLKTYSLEGTGITSSLLTSYMMCPRKFLFDINLWKSKEPSTALQFGSLFHSVLDLWYQGKTKTAIAKAINDYSFEGTITPEEAAFMQETATILFKGYQLKYASDMDRKHNPELKFDIQYKGFRFRGKMDDIMDGVDLMETKTRGQISNNYEKTLALHFQSMFYALAFRVMYRRPPEKTIHNVIRFSKKAGLEADIKKNPDYYFHRWIIQWSVKDLEQFEFELLAKLKDLKTRQVWWHNLCACDMYSGCSFSSACANDDYSNLTKKKTLFVELDS